MWAQVGLLAIFMYLAMPCAHGCTLNHRRWRASVCGCALLSSGSHIGPMSIPTDLADKIDFITGLSFFPEPTLGRVRPAKVQGTDYVVSAAGPGVGWEGALRVGGGGASSCCLWACARVCACVMCVCVGVSVHVCTAYTSA